MSLVEEFFSSSLTVLRVVKFLYESGRYATMYEIRKATGLAVTRKTLEKLVELGVLEKDPILLTYRLNEGNEFVREFIGFLKRVGYLE